MSELPNRLENDSSKNYDQNISQESLNKSNQSRREFLRNMLKISAGLGASLVLGKKVSDEANVLPQNLRQVQGLPERWSNEEHLNWLHEIEQEFYLAQTVDDRQNALSKLVSADVAFESQLERHRTIMRKKAEFEWKIGAKPYIYNARDEVYDAYNERLLKTYKLIGPEYLAKLFNEERKVDPPLNQQEAFKNSIFHIGVLVDNCEQDLSPDFATELAKEFVKLQPNLIAEMKTHLATEFKRTGGLRSDLAGMLEMMIPMFERLLN